MIRIEKLRRDRGQSLKSIRKELVARRRRVKETIKGEKILREVKRKRSIGGRIGIGFQKGVQIGRRGITRSLYDREAPTYGASKLKSPSSNLTPTGGIKTGKRGRPHGSYDQRYAKWGGVYGYRKAMAQKRRLERIRLQQQGQITPRQRQTLQRIEYQRAVSQQQRRANDPFFGTDGNVQLGNIMQQINDATNLVN